MSSLTRKSTAGTHQFQRHTVGHVRSTAWRELDVGLAGSERRRNSRRAPAHRSLPQLVQLLTPFWPEWYRTARRVSVCTPLSPPDLSPERSCSLRCRQVPTGQSELRCTASERCTRRGRARAAGMAAAAITRARRTRAPSRTCTARASGPPRRAHALVRASERAGHQQSVEG